MDWCSKDIKFPLTIDELKEQNFPKIYAKVSGYIIAKTMQRDTKKVTDYIKVRISHKKNTITGLANLIDAFATYMANVAYSGTNASQSGVVITTTTGTQYPLGFVNPGVVSATSSGATVAFLATDNSNLSYNAASEQLITQSAHVNVPAATGSVPITKQSNETLSITWLINIDISTSSSIQYIPTVVPQSGGFTGCSGSAYGYVYCSVNQGNSLYGSGGGSCSLVGLTQQYAGDNFVTTQLFTDMFYNTYYQGGSSSFVATTSNSIYLFTPYCLPYFIAGTNGNSGSYGVFMIPVSTHPYYGYWTYSSTFNPIYLQLFYYQQAISYMGVQVVYST